MTRGRLAILVASSMATIAFVPQIVSADGKYFPEKAYKVGPAIPTQRAILVYKDGIEKLTIESSLDGKGQEFGWVIPLPSRPTEFKEASPGLIKALDWTIQPKVTHDLKGKLARFGGVAVLVTLICLIMTLTRPPVRVLLLVPITVFGVLSLLMPTLHRAASFAGPSIDVSGVQVRDVQEVGSYDVAVLDANDAAALGTWLEANGFAGITETDGTIVSDYIREGWCFVAAHLRREKDGYSRPHPLSMSFPAKAPIYPMRLTATAGNDLYLELFVIADRQATCGGLALEVADTYDRKKTAKWALSTGGVDPGFSGRAYHQEVGHPAAAEQFWDGCVVSRLCGTLTPRQMADDISLQLAAYEPYREHYYSRRGACEKAVTFALGAWCVLLVSLAVVFRMAMNLQRKHAVFLKCAVVPALLVSLLTWAVTYAVLPKVDTRSLGRGGVHPRIYEKVLQASRLIEADAIAEEHKYFAGMGRDETASLVASYYAAKGITNGFTGEPIRHEDSPGNYTIFQDDRGIVWRTYSLGGYPTDVVVTAPAGK